MKVLFIVPYPPGEAPSQRFRFEQYLHFLSERGIEYKIASFLDLKTWNILYKKGNTLKKAFGIFRGFLKRFLLLFSVPTYDLIFIHREAAPIGPPVFEWILAKLFRKKIIYDFDDAIWLPNTSSHNTVASRLKWHGKVKDICKWSWKISCGNDFLAEYASQFNDQVIVNPTTIDTEHLHNKTKDQRTDRTTIGWTGTHSTIPYLNSLIEMLGDLQEELDFDLIIISNREPEFHLKSMKFIPWSHDSEIQDLLKLNIGLMPLTDDPWARGKCGFKALQYMALGIPAVVSPVGVNINIVENGINGFICKDLKCFELRLRQLIADASLRDKMGKAARDKIINSYSVISNKENFLSLFSYQ